VWRLRDGDRDVLWGRTVYRSGQWVEHYTEDAVFVAPGAPAVRGRDALTKMSKAMRPLSSVKLTDLKTDGFGKLAAVYGRGTWVNGAGSATATMTNVRLIIVWRKEEDGRWRIAQELLHPEPVSK
jgi:ketosteroid isomerase-like protein